MSEMRENLHPSVAAVSGQREQVRVMTASAVCVALLAVSAYISFPLPFTPAMVTALTIMVNLVAFLMKPKQAGIILGIYLLHFTYEENLDRQKADLKVVSSRC